MAKRVTATGPIEGPWSLPDTWCWRPLGELGEFLNGAAFKPSDWGDSGTPIIRIQNLNNPDRAMNRTTRTVNERLMVRAGDLLVSWSATLDAFLWRREDAWLNQHIFKVNPHESLVDRRYMFFLLKNEIENLKKTEHLHGSTMMHINRGPFLAHLVPVPPIDTQVKVAARIDELVAEIDDGETALARAREDLATWRKALLKAAVTGELTADWRAANPPAETGADLLTRILAGRSETDARRRVRGSSAEPVVDVSAPVGWADASFDQLFDVVSDNGLKVKEREYLREGRFPIIDQGARTIAGYTDDETMVRRPERPWILFGDHSRRFKAVSHPFCVGADGIKIIRPVAEIDSAFAYRMLQAAHFEDRGYSRHFQFVRALRFVLPSFAEQRHIAELVNALLAEGETLRDDCVDLSTGAATLRQSILAAAFRGELA